MSCTSPKAKSVDMGYFHRPIKAIWFTCLPETAHQTASHHFIRHLLNLRHVVVVNGLLTAVIPFDGYARPIRFSDGALVGSIVLPANTVADVKLSGLFAGHFHH
jgi:hypothetical protein